MSEYAPSGRYRARSRGSGEPEGSTLMLVFDTAGRLHLPLTTFGDDATSHTLVTPQTVATYLAALLPFFTYLESDPRQLQAGTSWQSPPEQVRGAVQVYLTQRLRALVQAHPEGFQLVSSAASLRSSIAVFLAALKLFYNISCVHGWYTYDNPLAIRPSSTIDAALQHIEGILPFPRMPASSGVSAYDHQRRLSHNYFTIVGNEWVPQAIDDLTFYPRVLDAVQRYSSSPLRLRNELVVRLLFETGARISEISGLTLGDWLARQDVCEAETFDKGSRGQRVKFVRFHPETAERLRAYCDTDRRRLDPHGRTLEDYQRIVSKHRRALDAVPLFLSARGTPLTPKAFRQRTWNPACHAAGIEADIHQARHWHVTQAVRVIYEHASGEGDRERRLEELMLYMGWRGGRQTLAAYQHYLAPLGYADTQDHLFDRMDALLAGALPDPTPAPAPAVAPAASPAMRAPLRDESVNSRPDLPLPSTAPLEPIAVPPVEEIFAFLQQSGGDRVGRPSLR